MNTACISTDTYWIQIRRSNRRIHNVHNSARVPYMEVVIEILKSCRGKGLLFANLDYTRSVGLLSCRLAGCWW